MGIAAFIIGKSGSGKSASLRNFKDKEVGIINVLGKPLPFKNNINMFQTDNYAMIKDLLKRAETKTLIIDDAGYLMTNHFMAGHSTTGAGKEIFTFYNQLADDFFHLIKFITEDLENDKTVYIMMHEDKDEDGDIKPKTLGKLLNGTVCLEGMCTMVLRSMFNDGVYQFSTQTNGQDTVKSPMGMFDSQYIDNDLKMVDNTVRKYYNIEKTGGKK